jgi:hypothetical protein
MREKNYLSKEELKDGYNESVGQGWMSDKFRNDLEYMIEQIVYVFKWPNELAKTITIRRVRKEVEKMWRKYDPTVSKNIFAWFYQLIRCSLGIGWRQYKMIA